MADAPRAAHLPAPGFATQFTLEQEIRRNRTNCVTTGGYWAVGHFEIGDF
jgi:hypothetical protein